MDETTRQVNAHREALGWPPLESADATELLLVEACAQYGLDRWKPGVLGTVLARMKDADLMALIGSGDDAAEHDELSDPSHPFAAVWRQARSRGLVKRAGHPLVREAACKRARTLIAALVDELETAKRRLSRARETAAHLEAGRPASSCPLPYADFSNKVSDATAKLDALIMLEAASEGTS